MIPPFSSTMHQTYCTAQPLMSVRCNQIIRSKLLHRRAMPILVTTCAFNFKHKTLTILFLLASFKVVARLA